jgi:tRNA A-37 threonylcarbamoyl transferase component Bud32
MAEAEVSLRYKDRWIAFTHRILLLLLPILLLFLLWSFFCITLALANGLIKLAPTGMLLFGEVLVAALTTISLILCSDETVFITRDGLSLPFVVCPSYAVRTQRKWTELAGVSFQPRGRSGVLTLSFKTGLPARFNLQRLSSKAIENLIMALDVWAGGSETFPALLEASTHIHLGGKQLELSYTEMWEDELARRFGATNFIPLEPGHSLCEGKFTVDRQLAFGGYSAIYLLKDKHKKLFVLKEAVVPPDSHETLRMKAMEMLDREAHFLSQLRHPDLALILDYFVEDCRHYLLMEYIPGQDLRRLVKEWGPQDEDKVLAWAVMLTDILNYLHTQSPPVIHRDLSPDNIILREDGRLAVIDFGAANQFVGTATGTMIGKQAYIAPEQLRGKSETRSDIYALGCTLFFLLTGDDPEPLCVSQPVELKPNVSVRLNQIVAHCTAMEPIDRPESAAALKTELEQMLSRQPV